MGTTGNEAIRNGKLIKAATEALNGVIPWVAFRWLVAQAYNAHRPQGVAQEVTKASASEVAAAMIKSMGGDIFAPASATPTDGERWSNFLSKVVVLDEAQQQALLTVIWKGQNDNGTQMYRLDLLMTHMRIQQEANNRGWKYGVGFPKTKSRRRR